jgi:hypothetical protein
MVLHKDTIDLKACTPVVQRVSSERRDVMMIGKDLLRGAERDRGPGRGVGFAELRA